MADHYTGQVQQDGPCQERRDGPVLIRKLSVGPMDNNVYVVACARTRAAFLVDAANKPERLRAALADVEPVAVLQTHGHPDHVGAWLALAEDPGLPVWGHAGDGGLFPAEPDRLLEGGERLTIGDVAVEVVHTPGHTAGSLHYLVHGAQRPHLFTGDSLFPGGPGRTTGGDDFDQLMNSLEVKVFDRLPDETWVYPGHGDDTTLGAERPKLPEWRKRRW